MRPTVLIDRSSLAVIIAMFLVGGWGFRRDVAFEDEPGAHLSK
jgi:flagellar biogenesis protein FliO